MSLFTGLIILGAALILFAIFFLATYRVVEPNEAHVIVMMGGGRKCYTAKEVKGITGHKVKSAYFYIPFLMKRTVLDLTNVKMNIQRIQLNDAQVAPFICDVIAWLHIENPIQAAERLSASNPFASLESDLMNIVQAVARAVSMKSEILDIMRDRQRFAKEVSAEVGEVLNSWGVTLVNLEVNSIRDDEEKGSSIIQDYERIRTSEVSTESRIKVAQQENKAVQEEAKNLQESKEATAKSFEIYRKAEILAEQGEEVALQEKVRKVELEKKQANSDIVAAQRELEVGQAQVHKDKAIEIATGEAEAIRIKGEKEADVIKLTGEAEGTAIKAKGEAKAIAKDKMAEALKKFNDAATVIEALNAWTDVQKSKFEALGHSLSKADLKLVSSGKGGNLFGFDLNAENGADIAQMLESFKDMNVAEAITKIKKGAKQMTKKMETSQ